MKYILLILSVLYFLTTSILSSEYIKGKNGIEKRERIQVNDSILNDLTLKIQNQFYPNIHSVLIAKNGHLVYEEYFEGADQNYGKELGHIKFDETTIHDVRSVTKSVIATLVGIAIEKKLIDNVNQPISDFFPEIQFNEEKRNWTIEHFLTMTTGLDWNEKIPYNNPKNDEIQMTYSSDPINYVLNKDLRTEPGMEFNYSGGATQILSKIVERASEMTIKEFAEEHLFQPLEISNYEWNKFSYWGGTDNFSAASGLRLKPRDMLKIGKLYRNKGVWNEKKLLSETWIKKAFNQHIQFESDILETDGYGYQFWVWSDKISDQIVNFKQANGNGDQNIYIDLENDIIIITTAGNYNKWNEIENNSMLMIKKHIYPALIK